MEEKEKRELFLEVIKNSNSVRLIFVNGFLKEVIISVKKYKELLGNGVITKESIFDIEKIMLIMPDSKQNLIQIENGRKYLSEEEAKNDPNQTGKFIFRIKDPETEPFSFYVKEGHRITERALHIQNKRR
ncbi:hypothetical protein LIZ91_06390 [Enterococcus avium]|uniref:hypothetical protein n=1 Tax=Enterococcus avium TaxID=33945 RepID=UPI001D0911D4|nr:hypothetical protein [Enterococcus avium]MCB6916212.1 hypothetical protein [Enterococcus avium]MCQ4960068.1 hypothetical protein [Enterococcus avium]